MERKAELDKERYKSCTFKPNINSPYMLRFKSSGKAIPVHKNVNSFIKANNSINAGAAATCASLDVSLEDANNPVPVVERLRGSVSGSAVPAQLDQKKYLGFTKRPSSPNNANRRANGAAKPVGDAAAFRPRSATPIDRMDPIQYSEFEYTAESPGQRLGTSTQASTTEGVNHLNFASDLNLNSSNFEKVNDMNDVNLMSPISLTESGFLTNRNTPNINVSANLSTRPVKYDTQGLFLNQPKGSVGRFSYSSSNNINKHNNVSDISANADVGSNNNTPFYTRGLDMSGLQTRMIASQTPHTIGSIGSLRVPATATPADYTLNATVLRRKMYKDLYYNSP